MADLRRSDTKRQRTERAMCAGVAVPTDNRLAWLSCPQFRSYYVHNPSLTAAVAEQVESEILTVLLHLPNLICRAFSCDKQILEG